MTHVEHIRKTYHITDTTYRKIMNLMDEVRSAIDGGKTYPLGVFERKMKELVVAPDDTPAYDHHMVEDVAEAFLLDERWEEVFLTLYKDEPAQKSFIEDWYANHYGKQ